MRRASNANEWHRRSPGVSSRPSPTGTLVHSAATPVVGFSALCRVRDHSYVVGPTLACPGHSVKATGSHGPRCGIVSGQQPGNAREIWEGSAFSNLREVIMTMSEYEERFRWPAPSLHQTFTEIRGPNWARRRNRRLCVAAALVGVMTITTKAALHHSTYANGSQIAKSGIQTCDFIHR